MNTGNWREEKLMIEKDPKICLIVKVDLVVILFNVEAKILGLTIS